MNTHASTDVERTPADRDSHWLGTLALTPAGKAWKAVIQGRLQEVKHVLQAHGQNALGLVMDPTGHPVSALTAAAKNGDSAAVQVLLAHGAATDHQASGNRPQSPLAWAIKSGSVSTVRLLLDAGARPIGFEDACDLAVEHGNPVLNPANEILDLVLTHIAMAADTNEALHRAAERGVPQWTAQLTAHGADPNHLSTRTYTRALTPVLKTHVTPRSDLACENGWQRYDADETGPRLLQVMIDAGIDLSMPLQRHSDRAQPDQPLVAAVEYGAAWAIPMLIAAGANPETARNEIRKYGVWKGSPHAVLALFA